jgi:hypothetical protein
LNYDWICSEKEINLLNGDQDKIDDLIEESASKIFNIFIERSGTLFSDDDTLLWMKEIIGYVLNLIDSGEICDKDMLVAQLQSGIVDTHFTWSRYRLTLKTADFMDDLSVIAPQDLMNGG